MFISYIQGLNHYKPNSLLFLFFLSESSYPQILHNIPKPRNKREIIIRLFSLGLFVYSYLLITFSLRKKRRRRLCKGKRKWNSNFIMKGLCKTDDLCHSATMTLPKTLGPNCRIIIILTIQINEERKEKKQKI